MDERDYSDDNASDEADFDEEASDESRASQVNSSSEEEDEEEENEKAPEEEEEVSEPIEEEEEVKEAKKVKKVKHAKPWQIAEVKTVIINDGNLASARSSRYATTFERTRAIAERAAELNEGQPIDESIDPEGKTADQIATEEWYAKVMPKIIYRPLGSITEGWPARLLLDLPD